MTSLPAIAVLAGGLATRMRPLTEKMPKAMLEVADEPFIAHQLRLFRREGISRVVLCTGYLGDMIADYVGDGRRFDLDVAYSADGPQLLGTGGALRKALPLLGEEFFVIYGDSYLDILYAPVYAAFQQARTPALMTVLKNEGRWDTSNVEFRDRHIVDYSKQPTSRMQYIDFGLSILRASVFVGYGEGEVFDLAALYTKLVKQGQMTGYEVSERFYEIGSAAGLAETDAHIRSR
jgi:NDP-sugar pyrophosphorylase family protein